MKRVGSFAASRQLYESLFRYPNGEIPPEPNLATDLSVCDDYRTYTSSWTSHIVDMT